MHRFQTCKLEKILRHSKFDMALLTLGKVLLTQNLKVL
jgi:hypothetical protein